ncbi:MAG: glycyl-radical enzyme activating protein [Spirochaetia bacterium]|nr:glycyl-radical enzyme activating protein [Spirochaetia bacterium]
MVVFELERYATEDGPGIRTVVFLKGCNLRCTWCQNPESHLIKPQVMYYKNQCVDCKKCVAACPTKSVSHVIPFGYITDHNTCILCGACVDACFYNARKIIGEEKSVEALFEEIMRDRCFYEESGGGVTFSGGEPLLQADELSVLARMLKKEGIHTALETAGHVKWEAFQKVLPHIDLVYHDLKHIDSQEHKTYTGVPLEQILSNISRLSREHGNVIVRIPVVPGVNDDPAAITSMMEYITKKTAVRKVELLPFHRLGAAKYEGLGWIYQMAAVQNLAKESCEPIAEIGRGLGLEVQIGADQEGQES